MSRNNRSYSFNNNNANNNSLLKESEVVRL